MKRNDFEAKVSRALSGIKGLLIVGVSGGADSVALLRVLTALRRNVVVVTCDFHLRGEESDGDRRFVTELCRRLRVECVEADMDVPGYMARNGGSVEMACRDLRYEVFRSLLRDRGASRIAVAHNADDNIETMLLNMLRGSGIEGLKGMLPDTGEIVRPLLDVGRREIEDYLKELGQPYRTDSSNLSTDYRRNYIRNKVLPLIEAEWNQARKTMTATLRNLRGEAMVLRKVLPDGTGDTLLWEEIADSGDARTVIHRFTARAGVSPSQVDEMTALSRRPAPGRVWHGANHDIHSERNGLHIATDVATSKEYTVFKLPYKADIQALMRQCRRPLALFTPYNPERYTIRLAAGNDRISPLGMKGVSTVSDIARDAKLTRVQRAAMTVFEDDGEIIWIDSLKRSRHHLIEGAPEHIYMVTADKETADRFRDYAIQISTIGFHPTIPARRDKLKF